MADARAELEIQPFTPHGQAIVGARVLVVGGDIECHLDEVSPGIYRALLPDPGDYYLLVERHDQPGGFDHRTLRTTLFHVQGADDAALLALQSPDGSGSGVTEIRREGNRYHVRVTLDYLWFSPIGYPPTLGNRVDLLTDGEVGWGAVAEAARSARRSLRVVSWAYEGTAMLERACPVSDPPAREPCTVQAILEAAAGAGARVQLLLWHPPLHCLRPELRAAARGTDDNFEVMRERNPTLRPLFDEATGKIANEILGGFEVGSYHQKTVVVDGRIGFCGGMNLQELDWDSRAHEVFDARRCRFSRPAAHRCEVEERCIAPDYPPRHDFVARVEGPAVTHLEENFRQRWNALIERGAAYSGAATPVDPPAPIEAGAGPSQVQVVRTMPAPFAERGILDVYLRAIRAARRLIYIEDQYFRSTHISDALAAALRASPDLSLIVVTAERKEDQVICGEWAYECFERIQRQRPGFVLHTLRVGAEDAKGARALVEVDIHAKIMMIDDRFLTIGSCNINDRGFEYEGEINIAVVDPALVPRLRLDLWREHLGADAGLTGDIDADVAVWRDHGDRNARIDPSKGELPVSRVFAFTPRPRRRPILGRDIF